jgi:energy-coupling factor transporter ATP-binding protein EcfA2
VEPQEIEIEPDVTALVGKNESGKTTILQALHRLKPANLRTMKFDLVTEYPRWRLSRDRKLDPGIEKKVRPVEAWFELEDSDRSALLETFDPSPPASTTLYAGRSYESKLYLGLNCPLPNLIGAAADRASVDHNDRSEIQRSKTVDEAKTAAKSLAKDLKASGESARVKALGSFGSAMDAYSYLTGGDLSEGQRKALSARLPSFFYFSDYDLLPGEHDLTELAGKISSEAGLEPEEESVAALLAYANTEAVDFLGDDYDARKAELQASALDLTRKVFDYWTQNRDLEVEFDTELEEVDQDPRGQPVYHRILKVLMRDLRHGGISTNFESRSAGFRWFFSFLAAFSQYQESPDSIVVLLDEPGTSLHGEAQKDFLRFIHSELGTSQQVIYTTHSQHMVDPARYEKLRAVEDRSTRENPDLGVAVTEVSVSADADTLLPMQAALGYSVSQHLFLGAGRHLIVEGGSDFIYLQRMSEFLAAKGRAGLDPRLAIIPLGSATHAPAFVALFARHMRVSVLLDGEQTGREAQRVYSQAAKGLITNSEIVVVGDVSDVKARKPDIEDLFHEADYIRLYNWAFGTNHRASSLGRSDERVIARLEALDGSFDHALPAYALTEHLDEFFKDVKDVSLERFEELIKLLNGTLAADS